VTPCPRCGAELAEGQEYCLECGLRLPGKSRLGSLPPSPRSLALPLLVAALVAAGGAAAAIVLTRDTATATTILTATGGSELARIPTTTTSTLTDWPKSSGWTNVLVSIPKVEGRDEALARAEQARRRGLRQVGVLDSSRFASLHPGYWVVFAGVYTSQPEATSRLREAKGVQRGAHTARINR
jgi:zinc ribbon protein